MCAKKAGQVGGGQKAESGLKKPFKQYYARGVTMEISRAKNLISNFLSLRYEGFSVVSDGGAEFGMENCSGLDVNANGSVLTLKCNTDICGVEIYFIKRTDSLSVSMKLTAACATVLKASAFTVLVPSDGNTRVLANCELDSGLHKFKAGGSGKSSYHLSVGKENSAVTFASVVPLKFRTEFRYEFTGNFTAVNCETAFPRSYAGEYVTEETRIFAGIPAAEAVGRMTENIAEREFGHPVGWSTWDYYAFDISEECIKENADFIADDPVLSKHIEYIAIDNGWQQMDGDWHENGRIKCGLKKLCDYIKNKGMKAGIWTAPARVNTNAAAAMRKISDILVRNEYGDPFLFEGAYVIDPTHPASEKYLKDVFGFLKNCGFEFYKIDFLNYVTQADFYYDKTAGHYDALRKLIEIIRETVGESAHIMGCGLPYGVGAGYVDSRRTGLDIHSFWGHIKKCTEYYLPQYPAHNRLYFNDLDYLVVRGPETDRGGEALNVTNPYKNYCRQKTPKDEFFWLAGDEFTYDEARFWASIILMSGSSVFLGDRLSRLNGKGLDIIAKTLTNADFTAAWPCELLQYPLPEIWYKKSARQIFAFNWSDSEKTVTADVYALLDGKYEFFADIFTGEEYRTENGKLSFRLKPHSSAAVKFIAGR